MSINTNFERILLIGISIIIGIVIGIVGAHKIPIAVVQHKSAEVTEQRVVSVQYAHVKDHAVLSPSSLDVHTLS